MKKVRLSIILGTGLIMIAGISQAQEKFNPEFRYTDGKIYRYKHASTFNIVQEMGGQEIKMTGLNNSIIKMVVDSVAVSGNITFINSFEEMRSEMKSMILDTVIDQKEIIGKRGKVIIDKYGNEVLKQVIDSIDSPQEMAAGFSSMIYGVNFTHFPDHPLTMGEKWTKELSDTTDIGEGAIITNGQTEFTLAGVEQRKNHDCLKITYSSRTELNGKMKQMGMDFFIEGSGEITGTVWFDWKNGIMIEKDSRTDQEMTYAMTGQMKMTVPMTQVIESTSVLME